MTPTPTAETFTFCIYLRKLLRTHIVMKIPTICLLTILTYAGLLFRFIKDSRSISANDFKSDFIVISLIDLKELYVRKDLKVFTEPNELGFSRIRWPKMSSGGSGQLNPIFSVPLSVLDSILV